MKAVYFEKHGGNDVLQYGDRPTPEPWPRARSASPCGPRRSIASTSSSATGFRTCRCRRFPGGDGAGVVDALGEGVTGLAPGDRVLIQPGLFCGTCEFCRAGEQSLCTTYRILGEHAPGTFAERVVVPARNVFPIPAGLSFEEAAAFPLAYQTAWRMIVGRAAVRAGETVLIHGAGGGVAGACVEIALLCGARVLATTSGPEKTRAPARGRSRARRRLREGGRLAGRAGAHGQARRGRHRRHGR